MPVIFKIKTKNKWMHASFRAHVSHRFFNKSKEKEGVSIDTQEGIVEKLGIGF